MIPQTWEYEGTWEEIRAHDTELTGQRVRLTVLKENQAHALAGAKRMPNEAMLAAIREAEAIQQGMNPKDGTDSVTLVRQARSGAMYNVNSCE